MVKILMARGADQSVKDNEGDNIIHMALKMNPKAFQLREFLDMLDPELRSQLLRKRSGNQPSDGLTPRHRWVGSSRSKEQIEVLRVLLEFSDGTELEFLDGRGDTPLHTLLRNNAHPGIIREVLQHSPQLLYRENAVGQTPPELIHAMYYRAFLWALADSTYERSYHLLNIERGETREESEGSVMEVAEKINGGSNDELIGKLARERRTCDVVDEFAARYPGMRRRLASLHEAGEVARRLGETYQGQRHGWWPMVKDTKGGDLWYDMSDEDEEQQYDQGEQGDLVSRELRCLQTQLGPSPGE